jgi:hypothetical protein
MKLTRPVKIVHLPTSVGGNAACLSAHLNKCGLKSESWAVTDNTYGYPADYIIAPGATTSAAIEWKKLLAMRYIAQFDAVFLNYGSTLFSPLSAGAKRHEKFLGRLKHNVLRSFAQLMQHLELFLLQAFNRVVMVQYQGDDARQGDFCGKNFSINAVTQAGEGYYTEKSDQLKKQQISLIGSRCRKVYALNPDLLHVLPDSAEFLPYSHISLEEWAPIYTQAEDRPLRIGHAPSHRGVKGTNLIVEAVENLKRRGFIFDFILVEGVKNAEAKMIYSKLDVLVDQLFIGWYGGLAVEAMALGKPVIAYVRESDLRFVPAQMAEELPVLNSAPGGIEKSLELVLQMPRNDLLAWAKRSRAFVERWHDPMLIAERVKRDIHEALAHRH